MNRLRLPRHGRLLFCGNPADLLLWELLRRTPEGETLFVPTTEEDASRVAAEAERLDKLHRPRIGGVSHLPEEDAPPEVFVFLNASLELSREVLSGVPTPAEGAQLLLATHLPAEGTKLSDLVTEEHRRVLESVERLFYRPDYQEVEAFLATAGFAVEDAQRLERTEEREISVAHIDHWLDPSHPGYGRELAELWGEAFTERREELLAVLRNAIAQDTVPRGKALLGAVSWNRVDIVFDCRYTGETTAPPV